MELRRGKAGENVLQRSVFKRIEAVNQNAQKKDAVTGKDCALFACPPLFRERTTPSENSPSVTPVTLRMDPITLQTANAGKLAVMAAVNDLAATGCRPHTMETVILLPPGAQEQTLRDLVDQIAAACLSQGCRLTGGHTEVTAAVTRPVVIASITGYPAYFSTGEGRKRDLTGCDILCTKWIGLEGTYLLATEKREILETHFPVALLEEAAACGSHLSVLPEAAAAGKSGVHLMCNLSEGGLFAALWKLAEQAGTGLQIDLPSVPIRQVTIELANYYDINPYQMESAGSLLLAADDGPALVQELAGAGIPAAVIGRFTKGRDRLLLNGDEVRYLDLPQPDALLPILG